MVKKETPALTTGWPADRRAELASLQQLLQDCNLLNNSTGTLDRLARIDAASSTLTKSDRDTGRASFLQFLVEQANIPTTPVAPAGVPDPT